jgi:hypothetical protein
MRAIFIATLCFAAFSGVEARADSPLSALTNFWRVLWSVTPRLEISAQSEAAAGIRETLMIAALEAKARLCREGGLSDDPEMHIPLPGRLGESQAALSPLGKAGALDTLDRAMNRAVERTLPELFDALLVASDSLPIADALAIGRSGDAAATAYLKEQTAGTLREALKPSLEVRLEAEGAFDVLLPAAALAGAGPQEATLRRDLVEYVLDAAIESAFRGVAQAETKLRRDPTRHVTPGLRAAFAAR